jgi:hypothetical protein
MRIPKVHIANLLGLMALARASGAPWALVLCSLWIPLAASGLCILGIIVWSALVVFWIQE